MILPVQVDGGVRELINELGAHPRFFLLIIGTENCDDCDDREEGEKGAFQATPEGHVEAEVRKTPG